MAPTRRRTTRGGKADTNRELQKSDKPRPEVRAKPRRPSGKRRKQAAELDDDIDGEELQEIPGGLAPSFMCFQLPLAPCGETANNSPSEDTDSLETSLARMLNKRYSCINVSLTSVIWKSYQDSVIQEDDLFWLAFEPSPEGMDEADDWSEPPDMAVHQTTADHLTGRLARIECSKHTKRCQDVEARLTEEARFELLGWWKRRLARLEVKRRRLAQLGPDALPPSRHVVSARVATEWLERGMLYLADAILTLEEGRRAFIRTTERMSHRGDHIIRLAP